MIDEGYCCDKCLRRIWMDTIVDNEIWAAISPTKDEGGLLCAACMSDAIADLSMPSLGLGRSWAAGKMISAHRPALDSKGE